MNLNRRNVLKGMVATVTTGGLVLTHGTKGICQDAVSKGEIGERYYVYNDKALEFGPGGWMPDGDIPLSQSMSAKGKPRSGSCFYRAKCDLGQRYPWMAVAFLPGGSFEPIRKINVAEKLGGLKNGDRTALRFYARSLGGAAVQFKVGGYDEDSIAFAVKTKWYDLGRDWEPITIELSDQDLTGLRGALTWVVDRDHNGSRLIEFHLDEIYFVKLRKGA